MSDDRQAIQGKIFTFLVGEINRKEGSQCTGAELVYDPGQGYRPETIRKWVRTEEPDLFELPNVENFAKLILEIAEGEADAKSAGKHRFVVRTHQHLGGRAVCSFPLSPSFSGGDDTAMVTSGGGKSDVIANHAHQLMRVNAQMFEGTIRVLGQQNQLLRDENADLRTENNSLRREIEEARSSKSTQEFQIAMAMEKNARTNMGFQKLMQIGTVVASKLVGPGGEAAAGGAPGGSSGLAMLLRDFGASLRQDQIAVLMQTLDMGQKLLFMEIMNQAAPPASPNPPGPTSQPPGANGTAAGGG